jgi:geranyl-CoA carboxylase alpha subunit
MSFRKILIANRGEIACRIMRTARTLGYRTVAVYSDVDADAPHVGMADEAVRIGPAPAAESYRNIAALLAAAKRSGAQAVHPGYGFLSENAAFARACTDAGLVFIGPPAEAIAAMGDKAGAKRRMIAAGVPTAPGYLGKDQNDERLTTRHWPSASHCWSRPSPVAADAACAWRKAPRNCPKPWPVRGARRWPPSVTRR